MNTEILVNDYHCSITAAISGKEAFKNICHVSDWWTVNFEGSAQKQGDIFTVRFGETFVTFRIAEAITDKKIVWHVQDCHIPWLKDKKEWNNTQVVWEISSSGDATRIDM